MIRSCSFAALHALALASLSAITAGAAAAEGFSLKDTAGQSLEVLLDGQPVARYEYAYDPQQYEQTNKPYLHVIDPASGDPITNSPGGGLYPHHRGIFIGYSRLTVGGKSLNLWGMNGGPQVHQKFVDQQAGDAEASFTSLVHWQTRSGDLLLEEERTFVFRRVPSPGLIQIDAASKLKAVAGDTELGGDPEHAGLHYRAANEVDAKKTRYLFAQEDLDPRKDKDLDWVGATYVLGDSTYSVVQMNHPENPEGTIWSAYRDYGRFGAFARAEVAEGQTRTLRYRFRVLRGELPERGEIQQWQEAFAGK